MSFIQIVPIKLSETLGLTRLQEAVKKAFNIEAVISNSAIDISDTYNHQRNQYHSSKLLIKLKGMKSEEAIKIIGVTELDLFVPILTFVFGEAQLKGDASVISALRLKNQFYGLPEDRKLMTERICKEAVHELAHNFGLLHCGDYRCVMKSSTYVEDIDIKSIDLCPACKKLLLGPLKNL